MKFNRDFINAMDGTGRLLLAFNNVSIKKCMCVFEGRYRKCYCRWYVLLPLQRPGSSVSLMSGGLSRLQRPQTTNPITLPTVCSPPPDSKAGDKGLWSLSPAPDQRNAGGERAFLHKADHLGFDCDE